MAGVVATQTSSIPLPSDIPAINYGGSDINGQLAVLVDTTNTIGGAISGVVGAIDTVGIVLPTAGTTANYALGILMETAKSLGEAARVRTQGVAACLCGQTVTAGQVVMASGVTAQLGMCVPQVAGKPQLGIALQPGNPTDVIQVLVQIANNA
jgi:hypothetical protein